MIQTHAREVAHAITRLARCALVASFAVVTLYPALGIAQSVPADSEPATTLPPVPVAVLAPVELAPQPYPQYPPMGRAPRMRTLVEPYRGGALPPGSELSTRANTGMIAGGAAAMGVGWLSSVVGWFASIHCGGFLSCRSESGWLLAPVVGPWMALADGSNRDPGVTALFVLDGVVQTGGLALMIAGGLVRHQVVVTRVLADNGRGRRTEPGTSWTVAPVTGGGQHGLAMVGTF